MLMRIILLILAPLFCNPLFFLLVAFEISLYHNICEISLYCDWGDVCMYMHMCNFPSYLGKCLIRLVCLSTYLYFNSGEFVSSYFKYFFFLTIFLFFSHGTFIRWWNSQLYFSYLFTFFILSISSFLSAICVGKLLHFMYYFSETCTSGHLFRPSHECFISTIFFLF